ncbi:MAG TPA: DNA translocase FtsK [Caldilineae bacterium]|nr:DNA translocase FtsK [Caldilineae bacterium]
MIKRKVELARQRARASKRRRRGSRSRRSNPWATVARWIFRKETLGITLAAVGVFTLISLPGAKQGVLTRWWIEHLQAAFGIGLYLIPPIFGVAGFRLIMGAVEGEDGDWQQPLALTILFLALLGLIHVFAGRPSFQAAAAGKGGGLVGHAVAQQLVQVLGSVTSVAFLFIIAMLSLVWATRHTVGEFFYALEGLIERLRVAWENHRAGVGQTAPLPSGKIPWYTRLRSWIRRRVLARLRERDLLEEIPVEDAASAAPRVIGERRSVTSDAASSDVLPPARVVGEAQEWRLPSIAEIFDESNEAEISREEIRRRARIIEETLASFGVPVKVVEANQGPAVTQFGVQPGYIERKTKDGRVKQVKVKVSRIQALANDLALALSASPIRIEAPVPGRPIVGIEVPNAQTSLVSLRSLLESEEFRSMSAPLRIALGRDVSGQPVVADLASMPHLLIAGATGSGKSVCINAIIATMLCTHTPETLRFLMIDPKMVELTGYNGIPHLIAPVVVDIEQVVGMLKWATREMERRYKLFAKSGARNIEAYNQILREHGEPILPYILVIVDELADLMMAAPEDVERTICRLAQMARATGIHLIIATQRPSVDVVTGLIKANFPARIAFAVVSQVDSRVILDVPGAERLLGRGDMLFMRPDSSALERIQGAYVSDRELERLVRYWKGMSLSRGEVETGAVGVQGLATAPAIEPGQVVQRPLWEEMIEQERRAAQRDDLYDKAVEVVVEAGRASVSLLQRRLRIGYSRAARLIDMLEEEGIIGPDEGGPRGRKVLIDKIERAEEQPEEEQKEMPSEDDLSGSPPRVWY